MSPTNATYYVFYVELANIKPKIWRRFAVPDYLSLDRLHDVIQIVMGWTDSHTHEFFIKDEHYTETPEPGDAATEEGGVILAGLDLKKGDTFSYVYDWGDEWRHLVTLEEKHSDSSRYEDPIACIDGEMACPLEDVGGPPGYMHMYEVLSDPENPEYDDMCEWVGDDLYDPDEFYAEEVNMEISTYLRWSRPRKINYTIGT
jgi:Plasmid pRiA4b ORF-3-like protein